MIGSGLRETGPFVVKEIIIQAVRGGRARLIVATAE